MSRSIGAPAQHKQPSRKGKKAWRKNVDITEVQTGLEALREEIIQGGPFSEKPSDELFALDTTGSQDIKSKYRLSKPLKADEILAKRSAIPAVDSRKRGRIGDGIVEQPSKRARKDWVSKKEVARLRKVADQVTHLDSEQLMNGGSEFDLWAPAAEKDGAEQQFEYVPKQQAKVAPATIRRTPQAMTANGKPVKAVKNPTGGTSYNPSFDEWDDLLNQAGAEEVAVEKARLEAERIAADRQARVDAVAAAADTAARADNDSEWEGFDTDVEETEMLKQRRPRRKTPAERNKANRRKEAERLAKHEKRTSDKQKQVENMVQAMITATEAQDLEVAAAAAAAAADDSESGDDKVLRRRKLGNLPIPAKALELVLPDELQESLRQLKPEGNLLQDRFRNLLVNGKIESRKPVLQPRKKKTKATEKWSYKDFGVVV